MRSNAKTSRLITWIFLAYILCSLPNSAPSQAIKNLAIRRQTDGDLNFLNKVHTFGAHADSSNKWSRSSKPRYYTAFQNQPLRYQFNHPQIYQIIQPNYAPPPPLPAPPPPAPLQPSPQFSPNIIIWPFYYDAPKKHHHRRKRKKCTESSPHWPGCCREGKPHWPKCCIAGDCICNPNDPACLVPTVCEVGGIIVPECCCVGGSICPPEPCSPPERSSRQKFN